MIFRKQEPQVRMKLIGKIRQPQTLRRKSYATLLVQKVFLFVLR